VFTCLDKKIKKKKPMQAVAAWDYFIFLDAAWLSLAPTGARALKRRVALFFIVVTCDNFFETRFSDFFC
jgi:hypothetical protein